MVNSNVSVGNVVGEVNVSFHNTSNNKLIELYSLQKDSLSTVSNQMTASEIRFDIQPSFSTNLSFHHYSLTDKERAEANIKFLEQLNATMHTLTNTTIHQIILELRKIQHIIPSNLQDLNTLRPHLQKYLQFPTTYKPSNINLDNENAKKILTKLLKAIEDTNIKEDRSNTVDSDKSELTNFTNTSYFRWFNTFVNFFILLTLVFIVILVIYFRNRLSYGMGKSQHTEAKLEMV